MRNKDPDCPKYNCDHPNYLAHDCDNCEYAGRRVDDIGEEAEEKKRGRGWNRE